MNMSVSCSLMGEGPGTGGSGVAVGAERGGLMNARLGEAGGRKPGEGESGVSGPSGICVGGAGNEERRSGTA